MDQIAALRLAIDLLQVPSRVRIARTSPLPEGVPLLLRLASGDDEAAVACTEPTGRSPEFLREAATFFIEQVLLAPDSDSYRVLGSTPATPAADLRRNMALLLRWLHPDVAAGAERSIFAGRITAAWEDLKTPERRAEYDRSMGGAARHKSIRRSKLKHVVRRAPFLALDPRPSSPLQRVLWRLLGRRP
jgi:hypothetical protein